MSKINKIYSISKMLVLLYKKVHTHELIPQRVVDERVEAWRHHRFTIDGWYIEAPKSVVYLTNTLKSTPRAVHIW
jgi:hypothetical protein